MDKDLENTFLAALQENQDRLLRICSSYAHDAGETEDLFQEVLINIWKALPSFKGDSIISTWMYRITLNVSLRHRAKLSREKARFSRLKSVTIEQVKNDERSETDHNKLIVLRNCIRALNEADKAVITLYLEELSYREISEITGIKENTIAVKIKRIKKKLLNCISKKL